MPQAKPPFKLALAALFLDKKPRDTAQAAEDLRKEYLGAPFFTPDFVAYQLHSLNAVGILQVDGYGFYSITRSGEERVSNNL